MDTKKASHCELCLKAFQKRTADIVNSGISYRKLAVSLYSEEIISEELYDKVTDDSTGKDGAWRLEQIAKGIRSSIKADPNVFSNFIEVLNDIGGLPEKNIARKLQETLSETTLSSSAETPPSSVKVDMEIDSRVSEKVLLSPVLNKQDLSDLSREVNSEVTSENLFTESVDGYKSGKRQYSSDDKVAVDGGTMIGLGSSSKQSSQMTEHSTDVSNSDHIHQALDPVNCSKQASDIILKLPDDGSVRNYQWEIAEPGLKDLSREVNSNAISEDLCTESVDEFTSDSERRKHSSDDKMAVDGGNMTEQSSRMTEHSTDVSNSTLDLVNCSIQANDIILKLPDDGSIRKYQWEIAEPGLKGENYVVCAPTGSGKTLVAALIIKHHLLEKQKMGTRGIVMFVVKTQQLAHQQKSKLEQYLSGVSVVEITGESGSPIYSKLRQVDIVVCTSGKLHSELQNKDIDIYVSSATLLILDECHHTIKGDMYAMIMEQYLIEKREGKIVPQVVGMTASPGAGRGRYPSLSQVMFHQLKLCARLDATSGIKCVQIHKDELSSYVHPPNHTTYPLPQRSRLDSFFEQVSEAMKQLESQLPVQSVPTFDRCSLAYQQWIKNEIESAQLSGMNQQRDQISILELLDVYVLALLTYEDFELKNAIEVLNDVPMCFQDVQSLSITESKIKENHSQLVKNLSQVPNYSNPLLVKCEELLDQHFSSKPDSKGLFFVRAVKHTDYVTEWIKSSPMLSKKIRPSSISGYSGKGMTKEEQISIIQKFRSGDFNLLVSTSVLEEGLDIPDCNLVIRFQVLSNEVADLQAEGRARSEDSVMHTIVASESHMHHNQLINNDKKNLAINAVKYLSTVDQKKLYKLQDDILLQREHLKAEKFRRSVWKTEDVELLCRKCGEYACDAKSVCKYGTNPETPSYIVPLQSFIKSRMKKIKRDNPEPEPAVMSHFTRPFKIICINCNDEWGVWGCWKNVQYPVLKCKSFTFHHKATNGREKCKQWKVVPFDIPSYSEYNEQED